MADKQPIVITNGILQQLQVGDTLENVVYAAADFGAAGFVIESDSTTKDVRVSSVATANLVTADSVFGSPGMVIASDSATRNVRSSGIFTADVVRAASTLTNDEVLSGGGGKVAMASGLLVSEVVRAAETLTSNSIIEGGGGGLIRTTGFADAQVVIQAPGDPWGADSVIVRSNGASRGAQSSDWTISDSGHMVPVANGTQDVGSALLEVRTVFAGQVESSGDLLLNPSANGGVVLPSFTDATRPAAGVAGRMIWNTDDSLPNFDDGTQWVDAVGNPT